MECRIRRATNQDAESIRGVVIAALRESNARDYSPEVIAHVEASFSVAAIQLQLKQREVYVASLNGCVVGTASLDGDVVRSVFIDPRYQRNGFGQRLMAAIHFAAVNAGLDRLSVPSSITAEGFYAALGYRKIRDEYQGAERTIVMFKPLQR